MMRPTDEQHAVVEAVRTGKPVKVKAYAGAGKTSTLCLAADARARARGLYLAFNREIANEAQRKFPANTRCQTFHSWAYRSVAPEITRKLRNPVEPPYQRALRYGLSALRVPTAIGKDLELSASKLARMVGDGVARFCRSAQASPEAWHIPVDPVVTDEAADAIRAELLPYVERLWAESINPSSPASISHDIYLKLWERSRPVIPADFILFDEAQDADGLMLSVLRHQAAQIVYVGDPYQQIYEWRGAVNAMDHIRATEYALTESFRFGHRIASFASRILRLMDEDMPVRGQPSIASSIVNDAVAGELPVDAVLCRKNTTVLAQLALGLHRGHKVAVRANLAELTAFVDGAERLQHGQRIEYPASLALFESWEDVQDYAESFAGRDLLPLVKLIDEHGVDYLRRLLASVSPEDGADYLISTVHKAKGLEWDRVRLAGDFRFRQGDDGKLTMPAEEKRLFYVGATRAKQLLDTSEVHRDIQRVFLDAGV